MDFTKILEYQKKDGELFKIERELNQSPAKKIYSEMIGIVKKAQEKSSFLENRAASLQKDYEILKKAYDSNVAQMSKFVSKDLEKVSDKDLESIITATNSILNNLNILEKKLFTEAEGLNVALNEFESAKKTYGSARAKYGENKKIYEEELKIKNPQIEAIKAELAKLEKDVDPKLLAKYKQLRADRVFPAFVKLNDRSCGGCRMELSAAEVEKVKNNGHMECDNCHRVIIF